MATTRDPAAPARRLRTYPFRESGQLGPAPALRLPAVPAERAPRPRDAAGAAETAGHTVRPGLERCLAVGQGRTLLMGGGTAAERWLWSSVLPALKPRARAARALLRVEAAAGLARVRPWTGPEPRWVDAVCERLDFEPTAVTALVGSGKRNAKPLLAFWAGRTIAAYAKVAPRGPAFAALQHEAQLLASVAPQLRPDLLWAGDVGDAFALVTRPVAGRPLSRSGSVPARRKLRRFLDDLRVGPEARPREHPWFTLHWAEPRVGTGHLVRVAEALDARTWPVVVAHGDFTPWNVYDTPEGIVAIDWEHAGRLGFPLLDCAFFSLKASHLLWGHTPQRAVERAVAWLTHPYWPALTGREAGAIVWASVADAMVRRSVAFGEARAARWWLEVMRRALP